jgi:glycosyltransferase involved in cell wall biosynthesis
MRIMGEKWLTEHTTLNISISPSNQNAGKKFIPGFQSRMIRYGVNTQRFNPAAKFPDIRKELGIPADKVVVVFVARVTHHKQPLALVEGFAQAVAQQPNLHLLMVGDGDQKQEVIELVKNLNISEHVTLQPFRQDVPAVLAASDVFVLPSLWEGLPLGLLEAMTMGKAIIASNVDGTCDVIQHYKDGILVETDKLVNNLVAPLVAVGKDTGLRRVLQTASRETAQKRFSIVSMLNDVEQIYLELLDRRS